MGSLAQLSIVKGVQQDFVIKPLHKVFEESLPQHSQKIALIYNEDERKKTSLPRHITYQQLNQKANQAANFLVHEIRQLKLKANGDGDFVVAVCMQPSDLLVTTLMAIWKSGAAYLPIDPTFPLNRIHHILKEAQPVCVICEDDNDKQAFQGTYTIGVSELFRKSQLRSQKNLDKSDALTIIESDSIAVVLYTSGSTGIPKGVRLPHKVILNRLNWQWSTFPYAQTETIGIFKTALTFVDSICELWGPLLSGLAILVVRKEVTKNPERLVKILEHYMVRRLVLVPTLLRSLLMYLKLTDSRERQGAKALRSLRIWICSGEPLPISLAQSFFDYFEEGVHTLYNFYGSTEVMGDVTYFSCKNKQQLSLYNAVPIGMPIANTVIYLLDQDYKPVKKGAIGEIFVAGSNLASGYVNARDPERFIENALAIETKYARLYRTGDFGSLQNDCIIYEGRTDSQIKIRGHRVDLSEVERHVAQLPAVDKAIVLCYHAGKMDQALLAFVKLRDECTNRGERQIEALLADKLADYMTPQVVFIDQVPLLVNGKVDRQALLKCYETTNNNEEDSCILVEYDYSDVPDELRTQAHDLFETVGSVIGRSTRATLTLRSNFYELGGNSLNSIFTVTLLREKGYNIGISEFIAAENLGAVLHSLAQGEQSISREDEWVRTCPHLDLQAIPLRFGDKAEVAEIIVESFYGKADLEQWLKPDIERDDYKNIIQDIWQPLVEKQLSFVVKDRNTDKIVATALNFDALDEPVVEVKSKLSIVFDFLEFLEGPIRDTYLPKGLNKILHCFMMGTRPEMNARENIACMHFMEHEVLQLAKKKNFAGILTTNTSPLTQQLGNEVYHYKTLLDYQVNKYVHADGTRPFARAPNDQRSIVHWKEISSENAEDEAKP